MEYLPILIVVVTLVIPIALPLIYWYVLKKKESRIYLICRNARRVWSVLIVVLVAFKLFQFTQKENVNGFEHMGGIFGQLLMAYWLWTAGIKDKMESAKAEVDQKSQ